MCDFFKKLNCNNVPLIGVTAAMAVAIIGPKKILQTIGLCCDDEHEKSMDMLNTPATCKTSLTFDVPPILPDKDSELFEMMLNK